MTDRSAETVLILGGGGMVGIQVAREIARELKPRKIVLAAVGEAEVLDAIRFLREEFGDEIAADCLVAEWGNIFVPEELKHARRDEISSDPHNYDLLFESVFERHADHRRSALYTMIEKHKPSIVVDCINTATAISYQNEVRAGRSNEETARCHCRAPGPHRAWRDRAAPELRPATAHRPGHPADRPPYPRAASNDRRIGGAGVREGGHDRHGWHGAQHP